MDTSPFQEDTSQDSGVVSETFDINYPYYESTPKDFCTSINYLLRKRKVSFSAGTSIYKEGTTTTTGACLFSPPASSTLNESLINNLEKFNIVESEVDNSITGPPLKCFKSNYSSGIHSAPTTPQKQIYGCLEGRSSSVNYSSSKFLPRILESPLNEKNDILYPTRKLVSAPKVLTPKKFKESISPVKKCLFHEKFDESLSQKLHKITSNDVIMAKIFKYLSNGDLYRLSFVSKSFKTSILSIRNASNRFISYLDQHKINKENYHITPPSSPEKDDSPPSSPESRQFTKFVKVAKNIDSTQSLDKCRQCKSPAYVNDGITQCSNGRCGFIYCKFCGSCSKTGPESFTDKCGKAVLLCQTKRELVDNSNILKSSDMQYSIFTTPISQSRLSVTDSSSGFYSETEKKCSKLRKNLTQSFTSSCDSSRILSVLNKPAHNKVKQKRKSNIIPPCKVMQNDPGIWEPPSPPSPSKEEYAICSRKSKRNLKRLTR